MNEKFFNLSKEKQERIINAAYKVFSRNSYKKSSMNEIAQDADISKSLLFHYFKNKKELYFFLWKKSAKITEKYLMDYECYESEDLFEETKFLKYLTPLGFADSTYIITENSMEPGYLTVGMIITVVSVVAAYVKYIKKDVS